MSPPRAKELDQDRSLARICLSHTLSLFLLSKWHKHSYFPGTSPGVSVVHVSCSLEAVADEKWFCMVVEYVAGHGQLRWQAEKCQSGTSESW